MDFVKGIFNVLADPRLFFIGACLMLWLMIWKRELMASNAIGYGMQAFLAVFFIFGAFDANFRLIMTKPDNVPIVGLIFILIFLTWYSMREAVLNDRRIAAGEGPIEKKESDRVWVWPDLVYTELISLILCSVVLILWSVFLKAPLEQPANRSVTPNPSKAPWYFLGLQEMLVYFDPWLAGVVLPGLIIAGLIAIPYVDKNPKGNGYYTFNERKIEITLFLFGFVILWVSLIVLGTFLRGPNWNFFGPFEFWDSHKLEALVNVNLSEYHLDARSRGCAAGKLVCQGDLRHSLHAVLRVRTAGGAREDDLQKLSRKARCAPLLRDGVPVPGDDVAADQNAAAMALQPEVHRGNS